MSSLFVNNIKHTNTQDAISIDTSGNVILDKVGTGVFIELVRLHLIIVLTQQLHQTCQMFLHLFLFQTKR